MGTPRIAVVGAGIGGLAAAAALTRAGLHCDVFDRRDHPGLSGLGLGIQISPNGARALRDVGAVPHPESVIRPDAVELRRWRDSALIGRAPLDDAEDRYGAPYLALTRAELSGALLSAMDGGELHLGRRCVGAEVRREGVRLRFADGGEHLADLVVGADGVHSALRGVLGGDGGLGPRFSGHVAYRAVIPADDLPAHLVRPHRVRVWLGPGRHCVCYPVRGGRMVNVVATAPSRSPAVPAERLITGYADWCGSVRALLSAAAGRGRVWPLYAGAPVPHRHRGGLVLLGDAAHPALPWVAQGASQALEDAVTLARCLAAGAPLSRYDALRGARAQRVAAAVRTAADEHHLPDGLRQRRRDRRLATPPDRDWLYGYDAAAGAAS
ncbi:FAD-dependent monooxygenase [Catenuloplanes atrovinosus]|uniref:Salicylate hydroxylase n=1 Tax=Catenuloplanes atrovinosus TaxID=137266 RepID=A0AAE3YKR4_9ACTN|nr:FAD-dependent monooxygenase [Catenuloplanes atrovinosus]MDR7273993.1 salicylate hydroxylase [Catenuloplanes atrovinosus]